MESQKWTSAAETRPWSDLPIDLLYLILSWLPYSYHPYFSLVCKSWRLCCSPIYPADGCPLLTYYKRWGDGIFHYYSPLMNKTFIVACPIDLSGTAFSFARDGWLALYKSHEIILANPISGTVYKTPNIGNAYSFGGIAFAGTPPHDCKVLAINSTSSTFLDIYFARCGKDQSYSYHRYTNNVPFILAQHSSPVPLGDHFYCLGKHGNLGVYNPIEATWVIREKPKLSIELYEEYFLAESEGDLLAVFIGKYGKPIHVFKHCLVNMTWETVEDIGSRTLFVGSRASLSATTQSKRMNNRICVARFHGEPELIHAEMKQSGGRLFFVPNASPSQDSRQDMCKISEASMCYYSLENGEHYEYFGSGEKSCSIWYEPRIHNC